MGLAGRPCPVMRIRMPCVRRGDVRWKLVTRHSARLADAPCAIDTAAHKWKTPTGPTGVAVESNLSVQRREACEGGADDLHIVRSRSSRTEASSARAAAIRSDPPGVDATHKLTVDDIADLAIRCPARWDRREFMRRAAALAGYTALLAYEIKPTVAEPALETTKIRITHSPAICVAPEYLAG